MQRELNTGDSANDGSSHEWLARLLVQRGDTFLPRFAYYYRQLAARPRRWRRLLQRKLAVTVTGAALLLALAGGPIAFAEPIDTNATINVVDGEVVMANNNKCSLMEAIWNARSTNAGNMKADCRAGRPSGLDTVVLPAGGDFMLTAAQNEVYGPTGLPVITSAVVIEGNGATIHRSAADGVPRFRILAVDAGGALTLQNTTISNGFADNQDLGSGLGGGILSYGVLTVEGSTITENNAKSYHYNDEGGGGGIAADGPTTITNSTISDNHASVDGTGAGGGILIDSQATATITGSAILDNTLEGYTASYGGGIAVLGQANINSSTIAGNVNDGSISNAGGGGIAVLGQATITGSTISNNAVTPYFDSYYHISAGTGGGLSNVGTAAIVNSTISGNEANYGGGVANSGQGELTVSSSTLSGNSAFVTDPGSYYTAKGGTGGGIFSAPYSPNGNCSTTTLNGVIVSGNTSDVSARQIRFEPSTGGSCTATMTVNAFNVFGQNGESGLSGLSAGATDIVPAVGLAAILSPLADNGGPTQTHALPANSPALDLAPSSSCSAAPVNGVDQRGEPRNQNGKDGATANECDAGSFELQAAGGAGAFLVSPASSGTVGGVAFAPADILKYDPAMGWSMYFDGSDVGVTKNLAAFEVLENGDILMSFATRQVTPAGAFMPQDVARFVPAATGPDTNGSFQWEFDGSAHLLTTSGEKIDALGWAGGRLAISTTGAAAVKLPNGTVLKAQDEDALGFDTSTGAWSEFFDGTPIPGLKAEDVNGLWIDPATDDVYVTLAGAFNLGGVRGNGKDIVKLTDNGGSYTPSLWWDGSAEGFPSNINGVEIVP
ncbi:MAG: right-handed parallel beta-helix repeat-containing protein [Candidatus Promineofilum sp.]|nr:right-handed parallel beta-helix repeat-containing protein [Promineifilum sp.]